jgi:hypothetical protein
VPTARGPVLLPLRVERRPALRYLRIVVDERNTVVLKIPVRMAERAAFDFLRENADWVLETLRARPRVPDLLHYLTLHPQVSLNGKRCRVRVRFGRGRCGYLLDSERRRLDLTIDPRRDREEQLRLLLREVARETLPARVRALATRWRLKPHGIIVRDQRMRWGSCSETGELSLNWRLILVPVELQDHIILHELAHLTHFDHSPAFHRLLRRYDRGAERRAAALNEVSQSLMGLGREPKPLWE